MAVKWAAPSPFSRANSSSRRITSSPLSNTSANTRSSPCSYSTFARMTVSRGGLRHAPQRACRSRLPVGERPGSRCLIISAKATRTGEEMFSLQGKVALVTGASRGLGWAMAQALARAGAHVILNARDPAALDERVTQLQAQGGAGEAA